jgi:hypothetical protein
MEMKSKPKKRVSLAERLAEVQVPPQEAVLPVPHRASAIVCGGRGRRRCPEARRLNFREWRLL